MKNRQTTAASGFHFANLLAFMWRSRCHLNVRRWLSLLCFVCCAHSMNASAASLTPATQTVTGTVDVAITPTQTLNATGFTGQVVYDVAPALPRNLSLNTDTGVISGASGNAIGDDLHCDRRRSGGNNDSSRDNRSPPASLSPVKRSTARWVQPLRRPQRSLRQTLLGQ